MTKIKVIQKSYEVLCEIVNQSGKSFNIDDFFSEVKKVATVKNWMDVRSVLQLFIDDKIIERTQDLRVEEYKILKTVNIGKD